MDLGLEGKSAVVCAASRGLGRAIALGLAREGADVTICSRDEGRIRQAAEEIAAETGANVHPVQADVSNPADAKRLIAEARSRFGQVDILLTNAGGPPPGGFFDTPVESYDEAHRLTLMSVITLVNEVAGEMKERGWGRIINLASLSVKQPVDGLILSNTIRAAVIGFAKTAATELAPHNVTVNNVCPGLIHTDRIAEIANARATANGTSEQDEMAAMAATIPMGRLGDPAEFANVAVFLASEAACYVTGATIQVDGGVVKSLL
ncbi:3-oxoacyl-ACP reductase [Candidatus Poribacteria bacterium]|nr:3-oxoacyl-ACP reductase [Candidatus Poribacteria bacterium]